MYSETHGRLLLGFGGKNVEDVVGDGELGKLRNATAAIDQDRALAAVPLPYAVLWHSSRNVTPSHNHYYFPTTIFACALVMLDLLL